jgi:hypothetical protein
MIAPARRSDAANHGRLSPALAGFEVWPKAVQIRQEWLTHGLSTHPADKATAERCISSIYARIGRPRPRFEWVDSPWKAMSLIGDLPTLDQLYRWIRDPRPPGVPPLASDLAMVASGLRAALSASVEHPDPELTPARQGKAKKPWPELPPLTALGQGVPLAVVLHQGIRTALHRSLATGFSHRVRAALPAPMPVCWYGQQDASWLAYYDALRRLGLAHYGRDESDHFEDWAALVRSCGWWWPDEGVCVVVDRPASVRTEAVPGGFHDEVRLRRDGLTYRDGWQPRLS